LGKESVVLLKMITQETPAMERKLLRLELARVLIGVAAVLAVFSVVFFGIVAFTEERDAWLAMRWPLSIASLLIWSFARSAKAIVTLEAVRRR
jgi:hypothetical protein